MERICSRCHAVMGEETQGDWCPACGGAIVERSVPEILNVSSAQVEVDHRGILLPHRHALGGVITPQ
jgi:RNA polymerase subunit RPABC4/transcription elongation factor Spt4